MPSKLDPYQIAYSNSTALLNAAQHQANLANFNSYLFNKEQPNKRFAVRNDTDQQPIYSGAQYLNGGMAQSLFGGLPNDATTTNTLTTNIYDLAPDSRPTYELTRISQIPNRLPEFKDFNAKPKMFIRGCS